MEPYQILSKTKSGVMWVCDHQSELSRTRTLAIISTALFILSLFYLSRHVMFPSAHSEENNLIRLESEVTLYRTKETIYGILLKKGVSLKQGIEIADVVIKESNEQGVPIFKVLAVMRVESAFNPSAVSPKVNAMGLMQTHPVTWMEYVGKMKLDVGMSAAFDPVLNVKVGVCVLKDLYDLYQSKGIKENIIWNYVLSAYSCGVAATSSNFTSFQLRYINTVLKFSTEYETLFGGKGNAGMYK